MTKYIAGVFNLLILGFDWLGIQQHDSILRWFMTISPQHIMLHLGLFIVLLAYALFPRIRYRFTQLPLIVAGLSLFAVGVISIISPGLFGNTRSIMLVVDIFFCIEGGVLAMLIAIELPISHLFKSNQNRYMAHASTKNAVGALNS